MGSQGYILKNDVGAISGISDMQLIESMTVGTAATTKDLTTTLNGDTDGGYCLVGYLVTGAATAPTYTVRLNGADWAVNRANIIATASATYSGAYNTTATIHGLQSTGGTIKIGHFRLYIPFSKSGYERIAWALSSHIGDTTNVLEMSQFTYNITTPPKATNITSIGLSASQTDGIGIGSRFKLYKLSCQ